MRYSPQITMDSEPRFAPLAFVRRVTERVRWPVLAIIVLYAYLAFHAFSGSQGIVNWMNNDTRTYVLQTRLENIVEQRSLLESRVDALGAKHLDIDALDNLSREKLYYSHPKEFTIWLDPNG